MRVAIVAESFLPSTNGVVNSVLRVVEHLRGCGHDVLVVAPDTPRGQPAAPPRINDVEVTLIPSVMVPKVSSLPVGIPTRAMYRALAEFAPDVVHLASPFVVGAAGAHAARRMSVPSVAVFQTDVAGFAASYGMAMTERAAWAWTRRLHASCDRTLAPSSVSVAALREHRIPRVHRWGRGVDADQFAPHRRDDALRSQWSPHGAAIVGFVGRLAPEKHVERLAVLSGQPGRQLVIVGGGPERARLEKLMPDAIFTGELSGLDLATAYASLDVFVHAGEHETFCQAIQEALASGVPVIGPDAGGPRDLVAPMRTGYLLDVATFSERLPDAVATLVETHIGAEFGIAARHSVAGRTWHSVCDELVGHYRAVIERAGGATAGYRSA